MRSVPKLLVLLALLVPSESFVRLTNIKCSGFQPDFATFLTCRLHMLSRGTVALNVYVKLFQIPVNNISINLSLHKKVNGYRPFLYNITTDFCKFQRNRKQQPFVKLFFDFIIKDSNINHTCPYAHDIIVKDLVLHDDMFKYLPLPKGQYMFQLKVGAYNDWKADVRAYADFGLVFAD